MGSCPDTDIDPTSLTVLLFQWEFWLHISGLICYISDSPK